MSISLNLIVGHYKMESIKNIRQEAFWNACHRNQRWTIQALACRGFLFKCSPLAKRFFVGFILSACPFLTHAQAYICPSGARAGERQVGMTPGSNGIASMPLCVSERGASQSQGPSFDPSFRIPDSLVTRILEMSLERERSQKNLDSLRSEGSWRVYQGGEPPVSWSKMQCCMGER